MYIIIDETEAHGENICLTIHLDFHDNMLLEGVQENWPLDNGDLEKIHKLYCLDS
jgi:hypothetical protein